MGDMLKLMQGGTDRTGFADMADQYAYEKPDRSAEERLALLKAAMEAGQDRGEIGGEEIGEETEGFNVSDIFSGFFDPYTKVDETTNEVTDQSLGESVISKGTTGLALSPFVKRLLVGGKGNPYLTAGLVVPEIAYALGDYFAPETTEKIETAVGKGYDKYISPITEPIGEYIDDKNQEAIAQDKIFADDLISQGASADSPYFDQAVKGTGMSAQELEEYEKMISNPFPDFGMADGGRVGMQQGGAPGGMSMPALLGVSSGSSGNLFSNYMPNPSAVPGPNYGTTAAPNYSTYQAPSLTSLFSPYSGNQFGNIGDYLGGPDPYAVTYDPYVDMGGSAYDQYGTGMTQEDIDKVFADVDKFSLAAQEAKRKAAEEAAAAAKKKQNTGGGGDGPGPDAAAGMRGGYSQPEGYGNATPNQMKKRTSQSNKKVYNTKN